MNTPLNAVPVLMEKPEGISLYAEDSVLSIFKGEKDMNSLRILMVDYISHEQSSCELNKRCATELRDFLNKWLAED